MSHSPASIIFNTSGSEAVIIKDSALAVNQPGIVVAGSDGTFVRLLRTATDGALHITGSIATTPPAIQTITGSVGIGGPVAAQVTNFPVTQKVYDSGVQAVSGSVSIYTQGAQAVSGTVFVTTTGSFPVVVTGVTQVTGNVGIGGPVAAQITNFPTIQKVWDGGTQGVSGSLNVYTQGAQLISGSVTVTGAVSVFTQGAQAVSGAVSVSNFPTTQAVVGSVSTYTQGAQLVSGSVSIVGAPGGQAVYTQGPQAVSGSVSIYTHGAQLVSGTVFVTSTGSLPVVVTGITQVTGNVGIGGPVSVQVQNFPAIQQIVGSVSTYTQGAQFVSGSVTVTSTGSLPVTGSVLSIPLRATAASNADVASSASTVTLLAANPTRLGATIYNDSTKKLYVKFGSGATTTSFTVMVPAATYYEVPFNYSGLITGAWESVNGAARITEVTP